MTQAVEAVIDEHGNVRLLEPVTPGIRRRALVIVLDEPSPGEETAILSEVALQDWNRPEEDEAWSRLQPGK